MKKWLIVSTVLILVLLGVFFGAQFYQAEQLDKRRDAAREQGAIIGQETTLISVDGVSVGIANYWDDSIALALADGFVRVRVGDTVEIGSREYKIIDLWEGKGGYGIVAILPLE